MYVIEEPAEVFEFEYKGVAYKWPLPEDIPIDMIARFSMFSDGPEDIDVDNVVEFMRALDPEGFGKVAGQMGPKQLMGLFEAWQGKSDIELGESSASID